MDRPQPLWFPYKTRILAKYEGRYCTFNYQIGRVIAHDHHGNTSRQTDQDQSDNIFGVASPKHYSNFIFLLKIAAARNCIDISDCTILMQNNFLANISNS